MTPEQVRQILRDELSNLIRSDRYTFHKLIQLLDGRNIQLGQTTGTKIGLDATSKLSVFGVTPVIQGTTIADPSGQAADLDGEARTAINALIDRLQDFGIIA